MTLHACHLRVSQIASQPIKKGVWTSATVGGLRQLRKRVMIGALVAQSPAFFRLRLGPASSACGSALRRLGPESSTRADLPA
jgi:hypothetical protein